MLGSQLRLKIHITRVIFLAAEDARCVDDLLLLEDPQDNDDDDDNEDDCEDRDAGNCSAREFSTGT